MAGWFLHPSRAQGRPRGGQSHNLHLFHRRHTASPGQQNGRGSSRQHSQWYEQHRPIHRRVQKVSRLMENTKGKITICPSNYNSP